MTTAITTHKPAHLLLTAALALYGAPHSLTPQAKQIAQQLIIGVLGAATAGGFTQGGVLETMLARCEMSYRVRKLARKACAAADIAALHKAFERVGLASVTDWTQ